MPHLSLCLIRMYPIKEVPVEAEALTNWLYRRFVEKEKLLDHFYDTGLSDIQLSLILGQNICKRNYSAAAVCVSSALPVFL